jgi:hypothetical protein
MLITSCAAASHRSPLSLTTMSSSQYPVPPPSYIPSGPSRKLAFAEDDATSPLLGRSRSPGGGIYDQPQQGDLPDDFKVFLSETALYVPSKTLSVGSMGSLSQIALRKFGMPSFAKSTPFSVRANVFWFVKILLTQPPAVVCQIVCVLHMNFCAYTHLAI